MIPRGYIHTFGYQDRRPQIKLYLAFNEVWSSFAFFNWVLAF